MLCIRLMTCWMNSPLKPPLPLKEIQLRKCLRLKMLPSCMQDLVNLCHLDIRGASRLKEMPKGMSKLKHLNFLSDYIVSEQEENGMRELGTLDNLHGSFCISNLENVKNSGEALKAKMGNKMHINTLKLKWVPDGDIDDIGIERDILDKLQPHENLNKLSIKGYPGERFPDWLGFSCYSNMTKLSLDCCMNCCELPSLGQLPSLQHLEFSDLDRLDKIGLEFYNKNNGSFQQETPFKSLETLKIEYMYCWREWHFPDEFDGFPQLRILEIRNCPVLSGDLPAHLPALEEFTIDRCSELACSLPRAPKLQQLYLESSPVFTNNGEPQKVVISETQLAQSVLEYLPHIQPSSVQCLEIKDCRSAISISADYLPSSLQYLRISDCSKLTFLDQLQHKSLRELYVEACDSLKLLPLGDFPNLKKLMISKCQSMECVVVPQALPSLQYLSISECPSLVSLPALTLTVPQLEELHICDCPEINCFAEEFLPPSLKTLEVTKCQKLASWITSKGLQSEGLTHLWLGPCFDVKSFPREGCLPASLQALKLSNFPNLETLDCKGLHHLTSLKSLAITDCEKLENITEEHLLPSIEHIYIGEDCPLRWKLARRDGRPMV
ncbi:putative disease resistance protein At3g14460 isoform X1 [Arachis stenosperma]|uniref:putative disease resistance protein At3g14460 isoform X1 n=1 Tax=Arachis stenosperma TaxID=217475 RepID=UPI0025ABEC54|nr:putative disease resistance protein At3g14460 isoform X1 [Arachis stenosperma]XP_057732301.1 putative disease resistance protein At3g14460 isoform X1 [Arachis stenosperma]XP_057732302.1 putative disease resistance protein At3g14460 isoform X1 [Arachis stenosperma]